MADEPGRGSLRGKTFYRYMNMAEAEAVIESSYLRAARPGRSYWSTERYRQATEARSRLALPATPQARLEFRITNEPRLLIDGEPAEPKYGEPGGGLEWMTTDEVEVEVIAVDQLD